MADNILLHATAREFSPGGEVWADGGRRNVLLTQECLEIHGEKFRRVVEKCAFLIIIFRPLPHLFIYILYFYYIYIADLAHCVWIRLCVLILLCMRSMSVCLYIANHIFYAYTTVSLCPYNDNLNHLHPSLPSCAAYSHLSLLFIHI